MYSTAGFLFSILAIGISSALEGSLHSERAICTQLHTQDHGCIRYTRGFDVTGVVTEIDLTFPAIKNECDCIQACLDRVNICANYVWKFSTPASVRSGHRTCTLYSAFNIPPGVTIDYNTTSSLNENIIAAKIDNPQVGGQVPRAYKDVHLDSIPDNDAVSGPLPALARTDDETLNIANVLERRQEASSPMSAVNSTSPANADGSAGGGAEANVPAPALEIDDGTDSSYAEDDSASETTSLASTLIRGRIENGRKYATLRDEYWGPSDEKQFETMDLTHLLLLILMSDQDNMFFRAPVVEPRRILDVGTGPGTWAIDVADKFPEASVHAVDMFPQPNTWVPPNCFLEVEDVTKEWTWREEFDFIHIRYLIGSFTAQEWTDLYAQAYAALKPGGWIEQVEPDCIIRADDGSLPPDSYLAEWGNILYGCAEKTGRSLRTLEEMRERIEKTGFVNLHEEYSKIPYGAWPKNPTMKEAGKVGLEMFLTGLEGFALHFLTKFGSPAPWSKEEVYVYLAHIKAEAMNPKYHIYNTNRRIWAQKP